METYSYLDSYLYSYLELVTKAKEKDNEILSTVLTVFRRHIQNKNKTHALVLLIKHLKNIIKHMVDGA